MIKIIEEYEVAVGLRQKIIEMITGVADASGIWWNDSSPNWMTKRAIDQVIISLEESLRSFGVIRVCEHAPCGSDQHEKLAKFSVISSSNYWRLVLEDGRTNAHTVQNGTLFVDGKPMTHTEPEMGGLEEPCPCHEGKMVDHTIAHYYAWPNTENTSLDVLIDCLGILEYAKRRSGPKMPRSAIRERLLKCVILLNDAIAPVSAKEYIAQKQLR